MRSSRAFPWAAAFALGAIVAPPDAIAATAVTRRLAVPRQIVTILEGESLLNDATALTIYGIALAVAAGAVFSTGRRRSSRFAGAMLGGVIVGLAVGWLITHIRARIEDTPVEMTMSLLTPYAAYLPAERLDASGVIATVAAGPLPRAPAAPSIMGADARLTGRALWEMIIFLLNGFVFIVMGLEIPLLLRALTPSLAMRLGGHRRRRDRGADPRPRAVDPRHGLPSARSAVAGGGRVLRRPLLGGHARRRLARRRARAAPDAARRETVPGPRRRSWS